ncbi:MAG TPA: sulfatase-like hydrolase/transferase, partial [Pirellulaceae bacterium]|nr:sulfatase-like hydrolase/transferase [Pirellulaceae bacterium]
MRWILLTTARRRRVSSSFFGVPNLRAASPLAANLLAAFSATLAVVALAAMSCPTVASAADKRPPNVVLIVADDLGASDLGCYGSKFHKTPRLDALAASGTRFTQGYAACPVCSPTRAALMTGKWPARLHLTDWLPGRGDQPGQKLSRPAFRQQLPLEEITLAERLKEAGYTTASIGKWHLGGEGFEPTRQGFDFNIAGDVTGTPLSYFAPFGRGDRKMPGLEQAADGEYLTDRLGKEAAKFIDASRDKPFFLYLPHFAVHTPMKAPADRVARYPAASPFRGAQNNPIYAAMLES